MRNALNGKRVLTLTLASVLTASMLLTGCGTKKVTDPAGSTSAATLLQERNIKLADYVKGGEYTGIAVTEVKAEVYTSDDFDKDIKDYLNSVGEYDLEEIKDRDVAELGDTVAIDYVGKKDGVAFDGGTGSADLTLGSGTFIPGFEDGLVGVKVGETVDLNLTFPENYQSTELAGADVVFTVTVNGLNTKMIHELTDELVSKLFGKDSVEDMKLEIINSTNTQNQQTADTTMQQELVDNLLKNFEVISYPEELKQEYYDTYHDYYQNYADYYSMSLEDFASKYYGMTLEELEKKCDEYADQQTEYYLVLMYIAEAEQIMVTDEEVKTYVENEISENNLTEESFWEQVKERDVKENLLGNKVIDFLMENANKTASE